MESKPNTKVPAVGLHAASPERIYKHVRWHYLGAFFLWGKHNNNKIILAKCPNTVWVSDGEELAEVSDIEVS